MQRCSRHTLWVVGLLFPTISGCATVRHVLNTAFQTPSATFTHLHLRDVSFEKVTLDFEFLVSNPNDLGVKLSQLDYALDLDGKSLAKGTSNQALELKPQGSSPVRLPLTITFVDFVDNLATFFSERPSVPYAISTGFVVATPLGNVRIPLQQEGEVPLPKVPDVKVDKIKLERINFAGARVAFSFDVRNRSSFPIIPKGFNYSVNLVGLDITQGREDLPELRADASQKVVVPLELSFLRLGVAVVEAVRTKKLPYVVSGNVDLGPFKQPFQLKGTAQL